ncbi:MAG: helix-turn-helix domain containing protein [Myxococcales bacterium]|nr:helix-turn-helix domain containing protein [Myxococcales bacterium]
MESQAEQRAPRTKGQRTRQRLLDATLELIGAEGTAAVTTGRIAAAAGLAQSSFYQHFKSLEHCIEAAGRAVVERIRPPQPGLRERALSRFRGQDDLPRLVQLLVEELVKPYLEEPELTLLYYRHRLDPTTFGRAMAQIMDRERAVLTDVWWRAAERLGVGPELYPVVALESELVNSMAAGAIQAIATGRFQNRDLVLGQLRLMIEGGIRANLELLESRRASRQ